METKANRDSAYDDTNFSKYWITIKIANFNVYKLDLLVSLVWGRVSTGSNFLNTPTSFKTF